jgi:hypothetical protein
MVAEVTQVSDVAHGRLVFEVIIHHHCYLNDSSQLDAMPQQVHI